jgi:hypothetical protein
MKNELRSIPPVTDADHHIRLEPAIVPFLFRCRLERSRIGLDADLE